MIGFKVDVGYVTGDVTNINQVTFLDKDKIFCFATNIQRPSAAVVGLFHDSLYDAQTWLVDVLGEDYYTSYSVYRTGPTRDNVIPEGAPNNLFPTYTDMFPNTNAVLEFDTTKSFAIYFKTLNRLCVYGKIYSVAANGSLSTLNSSMSVLYYDTGSSATIRRIPVICIDNYSEGVDMTTLTYWEMWTYLAGSPRKWFTILSSVSKLLTQALFTSTTVPDYTKIPSGPDGPYSPGGGSTEGDTPPGTFDDTSDPIPDSSLPTLSASDTGFTRIYNPTLSQVQALARYLWTEPSVLETIWNHIKQFFEDPMQAIIGFNLVPCKVPDGGTKSFALMFIDTGVQMTAAANQFADVDCGTVTLDRYYGSALDQNPYTKVSCFLPFIGTVHLNTDEVMGATLQVKYRIDIVTGSCVAKILVDGSVLYQYSGHCAISIPFSAADFSSYVSAAISVGSALAGMAVGSAAGGSVEASTGTGVIQSTGSTGATPSTSLSPIPQGQAPAISTPRSFAQEQIAYMTANPPPSGGSTDASFTGLEPENVVNTVGQVMGGKMQIEHSGAFSGNSGYLGVRRPFLIIERPNMCLPVTYGQLNGYPSMITLNLGECSGFTRVQQVQLTGCTATNPEQSEILQFLKSGVVL